MPRPHWAIWPIVALSSIAGALRQAESPNPSFPAVCPSYNGSEFISPDSQNVYKIECDLDRYGADLGDPIEIFDRSFIGCLSECDKQPGCLAVAYDQSGEIAFCYLKAELRAPSPKRHIWGAVKKGLAASQSITQTSVQASSPAEPTLSISTGGFYPAPGPIIIGSLPPLLPSNSSDATTHSNSITVSTSSSDQSISLPSPGAPTFTVPVSSFRPLPTTYRTTGAPFNTSRVYGTSSEAPGTGIPVPATHVVPSPSGTGVVAPVDPVGAPLTTVTAGTSPVRVRPSTTGTRASSSHVVHNTTWTSQRTSVPTRLHATNATKRPQLPTASRVNGTHLPTFRWSNTTSHPMSTGLASTHRPAHNTTGNGTHLPTIKWSNSTSHPASTGLASIHHPTHSITSNSTHLPTFRWSNSTSHPASTGFTSIHCPTHSRNGTTVVPAPTALPGGGSSHTFVIASSPYTQSKPTGSLTSTGSKEGISTSGRPVSVERPTSETSRTITSTVSVDIPSFQTPETVTKVGPLVVTKETDTVTETVSRNGPLIQLQTVTRVISDAGTMQQETILVTKKVTFTTTQTFEANTKSRSQATDLAQVDPTIISSSVDVNPSASTVQAGPTTSSIHLPHSSGAHNSSLTHSNSSTSTHPRSSYRPTYRPTSFHHSGSRNAASGALKAPITTFGMIVTLVAVLSALL